MASNGAIRVGPHVTSEAMSNCLQRSRRESGSGSYHGRRRCAKRIGVSAYGFGTSSVMPRIRRQAGHAIALLPPIPCSPAAFIRGIAGLSAILADDFLVALEPEFGWRDADENVMAALIPFRHAIGSEPSAEAICQCRCAVASRGASGKVRGDTG